MFPIYYRTKQQREGSSAGESVRRGAQKEMQRTLQMRKRERGKEKNGAERETPLKVHYFV